MCFVFYLALSYVASKNLETFQETSSRLPGTPLPVVTRLVVSWAATRFLLLSTLQEEKSREDDNNNDHYHSSNQKFGEKSA